MGVVSPSPSSNKAKAEAKVTNAKANANATANSAPLPAKVEPEEIIISPQPGPQTQFLSSPADIVVYGGAAGGGKTFGLLLEPLRHIHNRHFRAVIFRESYVQIMGDKGLWDESMEIYPLLGATSNKTEKKWSFASGATISFSHLATDADLDSHQGLQYTFVGWDELTHFTKRQFMYLLSRLRSARAGIRPYVRATCNPDADSWVAKFISWWIGEDGYAIPERCGVLRWLVAWGGDYHWFDTKEGFREVFSAEDYPDMEPLSVTFILSTLENNPILLENDPSYRSRLMAQDLVDRERLLGDKYRGGNWKIRREAGTVFKLDWMKRRYSLDLLPILRTKFTYMVMTVDTASKQGVGNDYSAIAVWATDDVDFYVLDVWYDKVIYTTLRQVILDLFHYWQPDVLVIEDASSGQQLLQDYRATTNLPLLPFTPSQSKIARAEAKAPYFQADKVVLPDGAVWVEAWVKQHVGFPSPDLLSASNRKSETKDTDKKDDMVDTTSMALDTLIKRPISAIANPQSIVYGQQRNPTLDMNKVLSRLANAGDEDEDE